MDKAELLAILKDCAAHWDPERTHEEADDALIAYIGDAEIAAAYAALTRWYA